MGHTGFRSPYLPVFKVSLKPNIKKKHYTNVLKIRAKEFTLMSTSILILPTEIKAHTIASQVLQEWIGLFSKLGQ